MTAFFVIKILFIKIVYSELLQELGCQLNMVEYFYEIY